MEKINWKRTKFVLSHAAVATIIASFMIFILGTSFLQGQFTGLLWLVAKEFGEFVGKAKAAGAYKNNLKGNIAELRDALDDKWQLWQTVGAALISTVFMLTLRVIL